MIEVHNLNKLPTIPIADLLPTQGNLKDLSEKNYAKLKNTIQRRGFSYPVYVWESQDGLLHLLDGHQRQRILTTEGWNDPIPYLKVPAKDLQEAMARLLEITSQYATITQEGIDEFIGTYELNEADVYEATSFDAVNIYGTDIDEPDINLPDGDKDGFQQVTFTITDQQADELKHALNSAKTLITGDELNENSNGNAIYYIAKAFNGRS